MQNLLWSKLVEIKIGKYSHTRKGVLTYSTQVNKDGKQEALTVPVTKHDTNLTFFQLPISFELSTDCIIDQRETCLDLLSIQQGI